MDAVIRKAPEGPLLALTATAPSSPRTSPRSLSDPRRRSRITTPSASRACANSPSSPSSGRGPVGGDADLRLAQGRQRPRTDARGRHGPAPGSCSRARSSSPSRAGGCWRWGRARSSASRPGSTSSKHRQLLSAVSLDELRAISRSTRLRSRSPARRCWSASGASSARSPVRRRGSVAPGGRYARPAAVRAVRAAPIAQRPADRRLLKARRRSPPAGAHPPAPAARAPACAVALLLPGPPHVGKRACALECGLARGGVRRAISSQLPRWRAPARPAP